MAVCKFYVAVSSENVRQKCQVKVSTKNARLKCKAKISNWYVRLRCQIQRQVKEAKYKWKKNKYKKLNEGG